MGYGQGRRWTIQDGYQFLPQITMWMVVPFKRCYHRTEETMQVWSRGHVYMCVCVCVIKSSVINF